MGYFYAFLAALLGGLALGWLYLAQAYRAPDLSRYDRPRAPLLMAEDQVSSQHEQVVAKLAGYTGKRLRGVKEARQALEALFYKEVEADIRPVEVNGIPGEWVLAEGASPSRRLLYLHGGSFRVGSPRSHRFITSELSRRAGVAVLAIDYRKQPEYKTIHCHKDARSAYRWILETGPDGPGRPEALFVAGDSAGGNLTLAVIAWARDAGLTPAKGAVAFAPLTDATFGSPSWRANAATDPFLGPGLSLAFKLPRSLLAILTRYQTGLPVNDPQISPLLGHLGGLPPTLLQVSRDEMLYGDSQRYANRAAAEGSQVTLQVWPTMVHVFQAFPELPEAQDALDRAAAFIRSRIQGA